MWRSFSICLAIFLFCTAAIKGISLANDPYQNPVFTPLVQVGAVGLELALAFLLLSGTRQQLARKLTIATFLTMAGINLYLIFVNQASCGCFGEVKVHPWWTLILDVSIATLAFLTKPTKEYTFAKDFCEIGIIASSILTVAGVILFLSPEPKNLLDYAKGYALTTKGTVELGEGTLGTKKVFVVTLKNLTNKVITVTGGTSACGCTATESLPVTIQPHGSTDVEIQMRFKGSEGVFSKEISFYSDAPERITKTRFTGTLLGTN